MVFVAAATFVAAFQCALLLGAPWGEWTLGGRWRGALQGWVRLIPLLSLALLIGFAWVIGARAGLWQWAHPALGTLTWVVVVYSLLGCVMNAATPSIRERRLWLPVCLVLFASSAFVVLAD